MKERLNQRAAAALVVLGLLAGSLSGCGQAQIGEKQAFSPNVTEQEQTQQEEQQRLEQLKISGDYDLLTASPWNCAQLLVFRLYPGQGRRLLDAGFLHPAGVGGGFRQRNRVDADGKRGN